MRTPIILFALYLPLLPVKAMAQPNIDPTNKRAWGENVGWTNWRDAGDPPGSQGVLVGGTFLSGFIWCENVGWINVGNGGGPYANDLADASTFGINVAADGTLSGLAWGENIGWINFGGVVGLDDLPQPAMIECADPPTEPLSRLIGLVWGENVGWINLDDATHYVSVDAATTPIDCDMNHDGVANGMDIQVLIDFLVMTTTPDWRDVCSGDLETPPDGTIDLDDVAVFVNCLLNG